MTKLITKPKTPLARFQIQRRVWKWSQIIRMQVLRLVNSLRELIPTLINLTQYNKLIYVNGIKRQSFPSLCFMQSAL